MKVNSAARAAVLREELQARHQVGWHVGDAIHGIYILGCRLGNVLGRLDVVSLIDISYKREEREEREDWSSARASQGDAQSGSHDAERRIGTSLGAQAYIYLWAIIFHFTDIFRIFSGNSYEIGRDLVTES